MDISGPAERWISTFEICDALRIGRTTLQRLKAGGYLPPGLCYYRRGLGQTAPCVWNLAECRIALQRLCAADPAALETYSLPIHSKGSGG
ncbi:hypothetical protein [Synechococcus sp. CS-1328]|uniref:hypothetical protein n=1 Tax=Synechococcus sp. CS-1328 TaxID=2847976 RepID=UPI00223AF466|nr:hypothetical protein [Synechococcus sp. CS-1328]MCT0223865.1 hypothetical protein [Synechococcus sp. CS-1328]